MPHLILDLLMIRLIHSSRLTCTLVSKSISLRPPLSIGRIKVVYTIFGLLLFHKKLVIIHLYSVMTLPGVKTAAVGY